MFFQGKQSVPKANIQSKARERDSNKEVSMGGKKLSPNLFSFRWRGMKSSRFEYQMEQNKILFFNLVDLILQIVEKKHQYKTRCLGAMLWSRVLPFSGVG